MKKQKDLHLDKIVEQGIDKLDELFAEACETERMMPSVRLRQKLTHWMDYKTDWMAYGYSKAKTRLPKPSGEQLDRYDLAIELLSLYCSLDEKQLIWATNMSGAFRDRGPNWTKIARIIHKDPRTAKRRYMDALYKLWYAIQPDAQNVLHMSSNMANN